MTGRAAISSPCLGRTVAPPPGLQMHMAALLLLLLLAPPCNALQPSAKPRGFKAAYEVEKGTPRQQQVPQKAADAAAPSALPRRSSTAQAAPPPPPLPLQQGVAQQCSFSPASRALAAAAALGLFALGVAVGAAFRWQAAATAAAPVQIRAAAAPAGPQKGVGTHTGKDPPVLAEEAATAVSAAAPLSKPAAKQPMQLSGTGRGPPVEAAAAAASCNNTPQPSLAPSTRTSSSNQEEELASASAGERAAGTHAEGGGSRAAETAGGEDDAAEVLQLQQVVLQQQQQQQQQGQEQQKAEEPEGALAASISLNSTSATHVLVLSGGGGGGGSGELSSAAAAAEGDRADIAAAGALVVELTRSLQIDVAALSAGERLQLLHTVLQAWQAQQAKRHSEAMARLGSEANALRGSQRDIAAARMSHALSKDAHELVQQRALEFRRACSDSLSCGLAVMLAVVAYQALQGGGAAGAAAALFAQCQRRGGSGSSSSWGLGSWIAARGGGLAWAGTGLCYLRATWDAAAGMGVLLAAPWAVFRTGLLSSGGGTADGTHSLPLTRLLAGLGLACGVAGYVAVGRLGGRPMLWLAVWEAWVGVQVVLSAAAHRIFRIGVRRAADGAQGTDGAGAGSRAGVDIMYERSFVWLYAVMWLLVALVLPVAAGLLPFRV